ncbi:MAG: hypothetical protein IJ751_09135, partial [Oscillospiraceae bacterium]|nr:hypothetical protein [Oscillospiraceae bacterium]
MILYHYSVDSYSGAPKLANDYKNQYRFAAPFLLALEKNEDCFWSTYFACMYYSRELCALGLRKHENYVKDAVEGIFEFIRIHEFSHRSVSRIGCVYYCQSEAEAVSYLKDDCIDNGDFTVEQVKLLEVEVEDDSVFCYDQSYFNEAITAMEQRQDLQEAFTLARQYFSLERSAEPLIE